MKVKVKKMEEEKKRKNNILLYLVYPQVSPFLGSSGEHAHLPSTRGTV